MELDEYMDTEMMVDDANGDTMLDMHYDCSQPDDDHDSDDRLCESEGQWMSTSDRALYEHLV